MPVSGFAAKQCMLWPNSSKSYEQGSEKVLVFFQKYCQNLFWLSRAAGLNQLLGLFREASLMQEEGITFWFVSIQ